MIKEVILEIYYNDLERGNIKQSEAYQKIYNSITELSEIFEKNLTDKQRDDFNDIYNLTVDLSAKSEEAAYLAGFNVGIQMAVEALHSK